ncbi:MAG TPA: proton-conducting transporter membrane subunit [Gemmataceae bacterium]|nr:proton-conducting transporter membrane subunit [Gemmataceae bacterium]
MLDHTLLITILGLTALAAPVLLLCVLGISSLLNRRLSEAATGRACQIAIITGLVASVAVLVLMLLHGTRHEPIELGEWVVIPTYHFSAKLVFDRLSVPFAILSFVLCGTIAAFGTRYMHKERGYNRFFVLYALFVVGMVLTALAGTIETLFTGWEMVGLSSALLVAYFQERPAPPRNGLRVWVVYRVSDAALLLAAIVMHHLSSQGDLDKLLGSGPWPEGHAAVSGGTAVLVGLLLILAAAGKSALVPFSGWLPRAMEGPTPSSAIFYGALSVHLGVFLLLRISPLLETSVLLSTVVVVLGLATAVYAYLAGSVQTDIKSALAFASLVQVGLIVAEIGLGLRYIALIHLLGNACLRTLQFIRAPTLLHDYHLLENALGEHLPPAGAPLGGLAPNRFRNWLYRFALERGYLDALLNTYVATPFVRLFRWCDGLERRWTDALAGRASRESDLVKPTLEQMEELP